MPKFKAKPHKGLLKRIRITKNGKIKVQRPGGRHLRSNKNGEQVRALRKPGFLCDGDVKRISSLLIGHLKIRRHEAQPRTDKPATQAAPKSPVRKSK